MSSNNRFKQLQSFEHIFEFFMSSTVSKLVGHYELKGNFTKFARSYSSDASSNVGLKVLIFKLSVMYLILPSRLMSAMEIFEFVGEADCYPNISVPYWILFTMTPIVASTARSFSKLKLMKNYLRSTMLNGLATLFIEKKLLDEINIDTILVASWNVRRKLKVICVNLFVYILILDAFFGVEKLYPYIDYYYYLDIYTKAPDST